MKTEIQSVIPPETPLRSGQPAIRLHNLLLTLASLGFALTCVLGLPAFSADTESSGSESPVKAPQYVVPEKTNDGWETESLEDAGLDVAIMTELRNRIVDQSYQNIHSMLLVRNGKLAVEEYFSGKNSDGKPQVYERDTLHSVQSVTKSVNSLLVGIAIDRQLIPGVEQEVSTFFPDAPGLFANDEKNPLRLKDCLTMTAGLQWRESGIPYTDPRNDAHGLNRSSDPLRFVLERPRTEAPGRRFLYNTGISVILGQIVHQASGLLADEFAGRYLFEPLGISKYRWGKLPNGDIHTGGGLWLRPRDMAKIGYLCLSGGKWQGKQIVSENWIHESTRQQTPYRGYGYQWWLRSFRLRDRAIEAVAAQGLGGQFIIAIPDLQMVAVFTGWNLNALTEQPFDMLQQFVLPATESPGNSANEKHP